jgi:hypothetical protein
MLVKCAKDAIRLREAIRELKEAPDGVLKDISESVYAGMVEGIYELKDSENIDELFIFLENRGFKVSKIEYDNSPALLIKW